MALLVLRKGFDLNQPDPHPTIQAFDPQAEASNHMTNHQTNEATQARDQISFVCRFFNALAMSLSAWKSCVPVIKMCRLARSQHWSLCFPLNLWYIYLHLVDFYGINVGNNAPYMDPTGRIVFQQLPDSWGPIGKCRREVLANEVHLDSGVPKHCERASGVGSQVAIL